MASSGSTWPRKALKHGVIAGSWAAAARILNSGRALTAPANRQAESKSSKQTTSSVHWRASTSRKVTSVRIPVVPYEWSTGSIDDSSRERTRGSSSTVINVAPTTLSSQMDPQVGEPRPMWPPDTHPPDVAAANVVVMTGTSSPAVWAISSTAPVVAPAPARMRPSWGVPTWLKCFISITTPPSRGVV